MESDSYYMGLALEAAREGLADGEVPVGAVLVDEAGLVLARAVNRPIGLSDPTAHAEILVLRAGARLRGNYRLPGLSLYVTIEPCIMCLGAMLAARVRRVVFGRPGRPRSRRRGPRGTAPILKDILSVASVSLW